MIFFIDGEIIISDVNQNIDLYYNAYVDEFGGISRTRWEGSKEYEIAYANAQRDFQNDIVFQQTIQKTFDSISNINEQIKRPAVLHSRVAERFFEDDYIATIRQATDLTKGIVAICVDYVPDVDQNLFIANLIAAEMLPAGQHMEGAISQSVTISNGQSLLIQWAAPVQHDLDWKITLTVDTNSQYAVDDVDTIVTRFLENFNNQNKLGNNITPEAYYQITRDAPWASAISSTYDIDTSGTYTGVIYESNYDDKFNATLTPSNVTII